ncbi:MAG: TonB-dependent receptor [Alteromonadaceae bacterium]|nr:MAG: TonB-dependent receptor [Alteromonadaceae bacterium]
MLQAQSLILSASKSEQKTNFNHRSHMAIKKLTRANTLATCVALLCAQSSISVLAQEPVPDFEKLGTIKLEEMIVTSQKRQESLQDVPLSVSVIDGTKLNEAGIENLEDLSMYVPNIHFTETGISTQVRVRGIGTDNSQGFEQSVGTYVDDVYYSRAQLFRAPMFDLERVEILRGPQSILFGKNSVAGALNLTTAKPTDVFEGYFSLSHEFEHEQDEFNGVLSGPLSENFRARLAVRYYEEDGYTKNTFSNEDEPSTEEETIRLTLDWTPLEDLSFLLKFEQSEFNTKGRAFEITHDEPQEGRTTNFARTLTSLSQPALDSELNFERQADYPEFSNNNLSNITLTTKYDFNDYTLTLVTASVAFDYIDQCDCDFTASEVVHLELEEDYEQFSQEIRLISPSDNTFEWIAGVYYQDYEQEFDDRLNILGSNLLPSLAQVNPALASFVLLADTSLDRDFEQSSDTWAAFAKATWHVNDKFDVSLGGRFTREKKSASKVIDLFTPGTDEVINDPLLGFVYLSAFRAENEQATVSFFPGTVGQPILNGGYNVSGNRSESSFDPQLILEYHLNDETMLYGSYTTGFKAGGFDPRSNKVGAFASGTAPVNQVDEKEAFEFEDESSTAIEIGLKTSLADGRGEINIALYNMELDDIQISQFDGGVGFNVGNAKETRVSGAELDGRWLLSESVIANFSASWLDFEYEDFKNGNCYVGQVPNGVDTTGDGNLDTCDYTGKRGVYTPEFTLNLSLSYETNVYGDVDFFGFIDVQHVDGHNVHVNLDPLGEIDAYTMLNARASLEINNFSISLLGKNLLDEKIISYSANAPLSDSIFGTNTFYSLIRRPRTIALETKYVF